MGLDSSQFWDLTLREIDARMTGAAARIRREHDGRAWLAWHIGQLTAVAANAPRKYPKLAEMMSSSTEKQKPAEVPREIDHARVRAFFIGMATKGKAPSG